MNDFDENQDGELDAYELSNLIDKAYPDLAPEMIIIKLLADRNGDGIIDMGDLTKLVEDL